jgi:hypothetical protein
MVERFTTYFNHHWRDELPWAGHELAKGHLRHTIYRFIRANTSITAHFRRFKQFHQMFIEEFEYIMAIPAVQPIRHLITEIEQCHFELYLRQKTGYYLAGLAAMKSQQQTMYNGCTDVKNELILSVFMRCVIKTEDFIPLVLSKIEQVEMMAWNVEVNYI